MGPEKDIPGQEDPLDPLRHNKPAADRPFSMKTPVMIGILFFLIVVLPIISGLYLDFLWFENLGYEQVFTKIISTQVWIVLLVTVIFFIIQLINLLIADKDSPVKRKHIPKRIIPMKLKLTVLAIISLIIGFGYKGSWQNILLYLNQVPFGSLDPVFGKDISFYVFTLPFFNLVLKFFMVAVVITFIISGLTYFFNGQLSWLNVSGDPKLVESRQVSLNLKASRKSKFHLSFLGSLFFVLLAVSYYLKRYAVLYSTRGIITGAGYTDVNVTLPILTFLIIFSVVIAVELFIWPSILKRKNIIPLSIAAFLIVSFVALSVVPGLVQYFKVLPNELKLERPFIENNIEFSRLAYGLDGIEEVDYDASPGFSPEVMESNKATFDNIRLWDHRPLKQTYNQLQEIRLYYDFNDVDIDRYVIDGK
ncbi:TPA: COG1615 family transporter, partial [Candidatus Woesearchaeota archaeon]|nr:COG1615 family transporter [Candidatus Woesearchaeota archaeon]